MQRGGRSTLFRFADNVLLRNTLSWVSSNFSIAFCNGNNFLTTILKHIQAENKFTLYKLYAVRKKVRSMMEGIQHGWISSVRWRIFSTVVAHYQYGRSTSSVLWRV